MQNISLDGMGDDDVGNLVCAKETTLFVAAVE